MSSILIHFRFNTSINDTASANSSYISTTNFSYTNQSGFILHFDKSSSEQKAKFSLELPFYYFCGFNDIYQSLGMKYFFVLKGQIGFVVSKYVNFNLSGAIWSSNKNIQYAPWNLSLGFIPSQIVKGSSI